MSPLRSQAGFTLMEFGLVLALIAGMAAITLGTLKAAEDARDDQQAVVQFQAISAAVAGLSGPGAAATNDLQTVLISDQLIPESWIDRRGATPVLRGSWGGIIEVDSTFLLGAGAYPDAARITASGLSVADCTRLLMAMAPASARIQYNTSDFKNLANTLAITNARARTACTNAPARTYTFLLELATR